VSELNVSICDGKYTVIQEPSGETRVLRYGEEWRDVTGDNVICGLAWELQESRERIKRLEDDSRLNWLLNRGLAWRDCYNDWWKEGEWLYASQSALEIIDKAKEAKP
jgi:hypothetical protein